MMFPSKVAGADNHAAAGKETNVLSNVRGLLLTLLCSQRRHQCHCNMRHHPTRFAVFSVSSKLILSACDVLVKDVLTSSSSFILSFIIIFFFSFLFSSCSFCSSSSSYCSCSWFFFLSCVFHWIVMIPFIRDCNFCLYNTALSNAKCLM